MFLAGTAEQDDLYECPATRRDHVKIKDRASPPSGRSMRDFHRARRALFTR